MDGSILRYRAFVLTAEFGSFTRAADALAYSQPQTSRMVAELEAEWGVQLLERSRAGVALTAEGARLLPAARAIVAAQDEFCAQVDDVCGLASGIIRIGALPDVAAQWLPNIIRAFQDDYPGMDYELVVGGSAAIEGALAEGRVDCGFVRMPASPALAVREIEKDELLAVLPADHPLAALDAVTPKQLASEGFLLLEEDGDACALEAFRRARVRLKPRAVLPDGRTVMAMVEKGLGVSALHSLTLARTPYRVTTRPLKPQAHRPIGFAAKKESAAPLSVQRFVHYLDCRDGGKPYSKE